MKTRPIAVLVVLLALRLKLVIHRSASRCAVHLIICSHRLAALLGWPLVAHVVALLDRLACLLSIDLLCIRGTRMLLVRCLGTSSIIRILPTSHPLRPIDSHTRV